MMRWWQAFSRTLTGLLTRPMWLLLMVSLCLMSMIYARGSVWDLPVAVVDMDHSRASYRIARDLGATAKIDTIHYDRLPAALRDLGWRRLFAVVILPQDLEKKILAGKAVTIPVYGDATNRLAGGQIQMDVTAAYQQLVADYQQKRLQLSGMDATRAAALNAPFIGQTQDVFNPGIGFAAIIFPGLLIMLLQHSLLLASTRINLMLRARGPLPLAEVLGTLSALLPIWLFLSAILYLLWPWVMGYRQTGSVTAVLGLTFAFLLAVLGLGKLLTECLDRTEHIYLTLSFVTTPVYYLSGTLFPLQSMPVWVSVFSHLLPSTWAVQVLASVNQMGLPWQHTLPKVGVLLLMGPCYALLGVGVGRWRQRRRDRRAARRVPPLT
ncbi:ABC transporter permease [Pantoea sp. 1.19]|uniref:ABC transporter permease n=1 Tax=Pantoea sp. 1.19 TaxID=1925589 RepID=UPI000948BCB1|nr:ABC transporter permease [Pantoea sp. 1.19]